MLTPKIVWIAMSLVLLVFCTAVSVAEDKPDYPHVTLSNEVIKLTFSFIEVKL